MTRVMTIGTFDLFHKGHSNLLSAVAKIAGENPTLLIGVNSDQFSELKKRKPINSLDERIKNIISFFDINQEEFNLDQDISKNVNIFINRFAQFQEDLIKEYNPDIMVIGTDWADSEAYGKQLNLPTDAETWFKENGILLVYVPRTPGISTTQLIKEV